MSGTISHEWSGSVLTVTSDSGTTASDLKGPRGDVGPRGPQGPAGVVLNEEGDLVVDLSPYVTNETLGAAISSLALEGYATQNYVTTEIAKAQLAEVAGDVDLSGFATKDDLEAVEINIDNKTIIKDANGALKTVIGGYANNGGGVDYKLNGANYVPSGPWNDWLTLPVGNIGKPWAADCLYRITMTFKDGDTIQFDAMFRLDTSASGQQLVMYPKYAEQLRATQTHIYSFHVAPKLGFSSLAEGDFYYSLQSAGNGVLDDAWVLTDMTVFAEGYVPIDAHFVPIDNATIVVNDDGQLTCALNLEGGSIDFSNFYTKAEIDAMFAAGGGSIASGEEVQY